MLRRNQLFIEKGDDALDEIRGIISRLKKLEVEAAKDFPLTQAQVLELRSSLREHVLAISGIEQKAVALLQISMK